jgi:CBS domain containing-hemolysin-like protein
MPVKYDGAESEIQLIRRQADGTLPANARVDLAEELSVGLPKGRYSSLAGFLLKKAGEVPAEGSSVEYKELVFTVTRGSALSIQEVKISEKTD